MGSLVPPFTLETAQKKVKVAQDLWNTQDPKNIAIKGYTEDSIWRNREFFLKGRDEITPFLTQKWKKETKYTLRKELFAFMDNKIAVQFWYEYYDEYRQCWNRCYGLEDWTYAANGQMSKRQMSGNEITISENERWFKDGMTVEQVNAVPIGPEHW